MANLTVYDILCKPIVTEKSSALMADNQYCFEVVKAANKFQIKRAVETIYKVTVVDVRCIMMPGKVKRIGRGFAKTSSWKKAIITLKEGDSIEMVKGV